MKNYLSAPRALGFMAIFVWGCAGPVAAEPEGAAGSQGQSNNAGSSGRGSVVDPIDGLPGVDVPLEVPPQGCLGGLEAGALSLSLNAAVPSVRLEASAGKLFANGAACTDADDAEVVLESLSRLLVTGVGAQSNAVILDMGAGDWSLLLATPESIQLDLGPDENSLVVRGTSGADLFRHGMRGSELVLDLVGDGRINVVGKGVTQLGLSLGGGDDKSTIYRSCGPSRLRRSPRCPRQQRAPPRRPSLCRWSRCR